MKKKRKMRGRVKKVIQAHNPAEAEKAEIIIEEADALYREIRVENVVTDENGNEAKLQPGGAVDVVVEADSDATMKKPF